MEKTLADLIARLPIPGLKESNERHILAEILSKELQIPIKAKQLMVKEGILMVSVPPVVKSALRIKEDVLKEVVKRSGIQLQGIR